MGRHEDLVALSLPPAPPARPGRRPWRTAAWVAAGMLTISAAAAGMPFVAPQVLSGPRSHLPWFPGASCAGTTVVEVVAVPLVAPVVGQVAEELQGHRLAGGSCLSVRVRAQDSADTIASSAVLPPSHAPQLWVGDSSLRTSRLTAWQVRAVGSFASTPVVMVSSATAVAARGWAGSPPTWQQLFADTRTLALPEATRTAQGQLAMIALWQSAGKGAVADRVVAAATLAARRSRYGTQDAALAAVIDPPDGVPDTAAPLVLTTEQSVLAANRDSLRAILTPIYPRDGSPFLDFPVLRIEQGGQDAAHAEGTDLILAAVSSVRAREQARAIGLRAADGGDPPQGQRGLPATVRRTTQPAAAELTRFLARWSALAVPSRLLTAIDVSQSMKALVPGTRTSRLDLAARAAAAVGDLLPDTSSAGLWAFALKMDGARPYRVLSSVAALGAREGTLTHRAVVQRELRHLDGALTGGGTGLFVTALAAVRAQRAGYDPRAANAVVLFTDGTNENDPTMTLQQLVDTLRQESVAAADRPVRLVCIGLGPGADLKTLQAMAGATGGSAYRAGTAGQLQSVLYDAIARRV